MINNIKKYYTHSVLWSMIILVTSGSVAQAFLLEYGFSEENVTVFCSVMQIVQVATIFFFSKSSDRVRSVVKTLAYAHFLDIPLCLFLLALCFTKPVHATNKLEVFSYRKPRCYGSLLRGYGDKRFNLSRIFNYAFTKQ